MYNHVRTILLNQSSQAVDATAPGHELVPEYNPSADTSMARLQNILLPDYYTGYSANARLVRLLKLVHAPELQKYAVGIDSRITYDLDDTYFSDLLDSRINLVKYRTSNSDVDLIYKLRPQPTVSDISHVWSVSHQEGETGVKLSRDRDVLYSNRPVKFTSGSSGDVTLVPETLMFNLLSQSNSLTGSFRFELALESLTWVDISDLLNQCEAEDLKSGVASRIFAVGRQYNTELSELRNIWLHSQESHLRLGALILGYVYRKTIEERLYV